MQRHDCNHACLRIAGFYSVCIATRSLHDFGYRLRTYTHVTVHPPITPAFAATWCHAHRIHAQRRRTHDNTASKVASRELRTRPLPAGSPRPGYGARGRARRIAPPPHIRPGTGRDNRRRRRRPAGRQHRACTNLGRPAGKDPLGRPAPPQHPARADPGPAAPGAGPAVDFPTARTYPSSCPRTGPRQ